METKYEIVLRDIIDNLPEEIRPTLDVNVGLFFGKNHVKVSLFRSIHNPIIISRWDIQEGETEGGVKEKAFMEVLSYIFNAGINNPNGAFYPETPDHE